MGDGASVGARVGCGVWVGEMGVTLAAGVRVGKRVTTGTLVRGVDDAVVPQAVASRNDRHSSKLANRRFMRGFCSLSAIQTILR